MEQTNCEVPWAGRHIKNNELMLLNLEESSKVTKALKKVLEDIEVEKGSLDKLASSSDKVDKRKYYYETAIMTADKKREELTEQLSEMRNSLMERENVESIVIDEMEKVLEEKTMLKEEKLQKQIEAIQEKTRQQEERLQRQHEKMLEGIREKERNLIESIKREIYALQEKTDSDKVTLRVNPGKNIIDSIKNEKQKNKVIEDKIKKIEDEIERQDNRLKTCKEDMERFNIEPISKRLATLEEKKKYFENRNKELQKELEQYITVEQNIAREREKAMEREQQIERAKNPCKYYNYGAVGENTIIDDGKSHWEHYEEMQKRISAPS